MNFIKSHIDFKVYGSTVFGLILLLALYPMAKFLPVECAYENSWIENAQLVALALGIFYALRTKYNKTFFKFVALVLGILFLREINCGRSVFFAVPGEPNSFYRWKDIKYGWLAHPLYGIYIGWTGLYFFINKLYLDLWNYIKHAKFPIWDCAFVFTGMFIGWYSEHELHNMVLEESTELLFYVGLVSIIYLYSQHKNFNITTNESIVD